MPRRGKYDPKEREYRRRSHLRHRAKRLAEMREYQAKNRERLKKQRAQFHAANRDRLNERARRWREVNRERILKNRRERYANDMAYRAKVAEAGKRRRREAAATIRAAQRGYVARNREKISQRRRQYRQSHHDKIRAQQRRYEAQRLRSDPQYAVKRRLMARMRDALRKAHTPKAGLLVEMIGCSPAELVRHLENLFTDGMDWENRHRWHIDHIRPCASFDLRDPEQQKACFHYSNLQPLWASDNRRKWAQ